MSSLRLSSALLCGLFSLLAFGAAARPPVGSTTLDPIAASAFCGSLALGSLAMMGALLRRPPLAASLGLAGRSIPLAPTALLALGLVGLSQIADTILVETHLRQESVLADLDAAIASQTGPGLAVMLLALAVAPGLAEELLFRGLLLRSCAERFGPAAGLVVSSLAFGAIHLDLAQGIAACGLGFYLGGVALATGGTRVPALCHMANNAAAIAWAAFVGQDPSATPWVGIPAAAAAAAGLWVLTAIGRSGRSGRSSRPRPPGAPGPFSP